MGYLPGLSLQAGHVGKDCDRRVARIGNALQVMGAETAGPLETTAAPGAVLSNGEDAAAQGGSQHLSGRPDMCTPNWGESDWAR